MESAGSGAGEEDWDADEVEEPAMLVEDRAEAEVPGWLVLPAVGGPA